MEIETIKERIVYENAYITIYDDLVRFPDGREGTYLKSRWKAPHGAGVVAIIAGEVLLVVNYRYQDGGQSIEIPQGFGLPGATPAEDARRELREETGLEAMTLEPLLTIGGGYKTHIFVARLPDDAMPTLAGQERTEAIVSFERMPIAGISLAALAEVGIHDANTIAALLAVRDFIQP
ncbi:MULTISPECIES: NUDIX domain-containing protein [unclassified Sphingomonas]|uniref:NUDIX domain-containing protein n=1 Tax=unclassified Sphingomonas TaxID=196159 RepID=UPI000BC9042E|nr:MAG: hypothetical protein B7Z43_10115 [Sphingomonas sp. 12-62-6]OYX36949.1 MAG: hypothetical protein B7Y98_14195 [Sphingomonas sp. 32-62-10]